jgi:DNA helicase-2/ATP-dependent DNA helicase PcrA
MPKDQSYIRAKQDFKAKTFDPNQFKVVKADSLDYKVGDRVSHIKFGEGTVLEIVDGGRDFEVKVDFDRAGVKRMFASFAKLKKIG